MPGTSPIIEVNNLSKRYLLGTFGRQTFLNQMDRWWARLWNKKDNSLKNGNGHKGKQDASFWALKDVSFSVQPGEVLGVIGRNGAGKSTLLKILSRITEPTSGDAILTGRSASLLEVGTGFHPDLTGRENIYLNGAILGMKRAEIRAKFDEIVEFAEISEFLDTPVKRYSSGMYVRLAFAVAAHLEPEILIIDEVLAVGDAVFQKKCLGKMSAVAREGRTVLFVSHSISAVSNLCSRAIVMQNGRIEFDGSTKEGLDTYLAATVTSTAERFFEPPVEGSAALLAAAVRDGAGRAAADVDIRKPFFICVTYVVRQRLPSFRIAVVLGTSRGEIAFSATDSENSECGGERLPGIYESRCEVPGNLLNDGNYLISISGQIPMVEMLFMAEHVLTVSVVQTGGANSHFAEKWAGVIRPTLNWSVTRKGDEAEHPVSEILEMEEET